MKKIKIKSLKSDNTKFGLGLKKRISLRKIFGLNTRKKPRKIKIKQKNLIRKILSKNKIGKQLKIKVQNIIKFYVELKNYKGIRHKYKYPVRGQRTRTNAKTSKKKI
jgi:small subunit ribosomal protein S13